MKLLEAAGAALAAGQTRPALEKLLEAWRKTRAPALASLITEVGEQAKGVLRPGAQSKLSKQQAWTSLEKTRDPAMLPWLLEELDFTYRADLTQTKLERLLQWPPDPRLGEAAVKMLPEVLADATAPRMAPPLFALLLRTGDPQGLKPLQKLVKTDLDEPWGDRLNDVIRALSKVRPVAIPPAQVKALRKHLRVAPVRSPEERSLVELFQAVYDSPTSDAARHVLADALQEQGDPRGTFIALQLARAATGEPAGEAEQKLWKRWHQLWSAPLGVRVSAWESDLFVRGFPVRLELDATVPRLDPAWSTVEEVRVTGAGKKLPSLLASSLQHVKRLVDVPLAALVAAFELKPQALPALERIDLADEEAAPLELKRLLATSLAAHLVEFSLNAPLEAMAPLAAAALAHRWRLRLRDRRLMVALDLRPTARALDVALESMEAIRELQPLLALLPTTAFERLRVTIPANAHYKTWAHLEVPEVLRWLGEELKRRGATATWWNRSGPEEPMPSTLTAIRESPLLTDVRARERGRLPSGARAWFD